jgi:SAM-dependent methyltransferase
MSNEWTKDEHVSAYLARKDEIPHRQAGEITLLSELSPDTERVLDLGCGDGHLLSLVLAHCPQATGVGIDFSPAMLDKAKQRFHEQPRATVVAHNLDNPLPDVGTYDAVVSSFAIHHCEHKRKQGLYQEVWSLLAPGGVFCNLEHVASPSVRVHKRFLKMLDVRPEDEDPSNKLLDVETQLQWFQDIGFRDVDCYWKWRELALLVGHKPT